MLTAPACRSWIASSPWMVSGLAVLVEDLELRTRGCDRARSSMRVVMPGERHAALDHAEAAVLHVDVAVEVRIARPTR